MAQRVLEGVRVLEIVLRVYSAKMSKSICLLVIPSSCFIVFLQVFAAKGRQTTVSTCLVGVRLKQSTLKRRLLTQCPHSQENPIPLRDRNIMLHITWQYDRGVGNTLQ